MSMTKSIAIGSTGLNVTCIDRSIAWYGDVLDFATVRRGEVRGSRWAHLGHGESVLLTLWEQAASFASFNSSGLHHLSFEVDTLETLAELENRAQVSGAVFRRAPGRPQPQAATGQVFLNDPDGIRLEIYTEEDAPLRGAGDDLACGYYEELT